MKISIVSINYAPEPTGIAVYSTGMAEFLAKAGHAVTVYTAFAYYPAWQKSNADVGRLFSNESVSGVALRRSYIYVPAHPSALRRILHEFSFAVSSAVRFLLGPRSDVTIIVTPPLLLSSLFGVLAKLKRTKVLVHVQDLQPDAAIDLGMLKPGALTKFLFRLESWGYRLATKVSTISGAMRQRIESKGVPHSKTLLFKNWANDELIHPLSSEASLRDAWSLNNNFVVLYSGNMGVKQGLGMMLEAASLLREDGQTLFLIVGDGGEKDALVKRVQIEGLTNVRFMPPVAKEDLGKLLATADVSVITQKAGIDDLVLPSKLGNLLSSERPIIASTACESELATIIKTADCGIVVAPEDGHGLAAAIQALSREPQRRAEMAARGRDYALHHLSSKSILQNFERELREVVLAT